VQTLALFAVTSGKTKGKTAGVEEGGVSVGFELNRSTPELLVVIVLGEGGGLP